MTDRAQATRFCSCSAVPAHISDSDFIAGHGTDDRAASREVGTSPAAAEGVRFCTCSDAPTGLSQDADADPSVSEVTRSFGEGGPTPDTSRSASPPPREGVVSVSPADLSELESLADLLPGESSLFSAFTHGEEGSEVLLTDWRILLRGAPDANVLFSSIWLTDVDSVSISRARPSRRSLIWGLIGLVATVGMWQALDGVGNLRLFIAAIVLLMSAVLLADYALRPPDLEVLIRAKSGASMSIEFAQKRADVADRFSAKVVAALEALRVY